MYIFAHVFMSFYKKNEQM